MANCFFCYKDAGESTYHPGCCKKFFGTNSIPTLDVDHTMIKELAEISVNQRITITGVQPKLSLDLELHKGDSRLIITSFMGKYILKPQQKHYSFMPETEDLTMHLAGIFKLSTCEHTIIPANDNQLVYLAKRFDRRSGEKIHMEDFCQLSGFQTEQKYKSSYERAGKLIMKYSTTKGLDVVNYFELVLFAYLTGNNDMHLKNFSLMEQQEKVTLSPAYDLLNVNIVNPADKDEMALTLNGKRNRIKLDDFKVLAASLELPTKVRDNIFKKFTSRNNEVEKMINQSFLNDDYKELYKASWLIKQTIFNL